MTSEIEKKSEVGNTKKSEFGIWKKKVKSEIEKKSEVGNRKKVKSEIEIKSEIGCRKKK